MEQSPQHSTEEPSSSLTVKLHELLDDSDGEEEEGAGNLRFQEEVVEGVMQEFYKEMVAFPSLPPPASPVFVDEGKNGSCGASVSDKGSSVMAGIVAAAGARFNGSPAVGVGEERNDELFEFEVGICDDYNNGNNKIDEFFDFDDEWVGRVLSWGQQNHVQVDHSGFKC